jgi:hypothetical protein
MAAATLTFLRASGAVLGKRYSRRGDKIIKKGAPNVPTFDYLPRTVADAGEFFAVLSEAEKHPDICLIRAKPGRWFPADGRPVHRLMYVQPGHVTAQGHRVSKAAFDEHQLEHNVDWLPHWEDQPTGWAMVDVDQVEAPEGAAWLIDPVGTAEHVRDNFLPPCCHGATLWVQITGSAHDPTDPASWGKAKLRFGIWFDRGLTSPELLGLFDGCPVDPVTFSIHQPIYTSNPTFRDVPDPVNRPRSFILEGEFDTVELPAEITPKYTSRSRGGSDNGVVRSRVTGAPAGTGLVDPLPEPFLEALERVNDKSGECRSRLGTAAYVYSLWVGVEKTDIAALAARLAKEGEKYRSAGEVAGYGLESLIHHRLGAIPAYSDYDPFGEPAGHCADEPEPAADPEPANDNTREQPKIAPSVEEASATLAVAVRGWIEAGLAYHPDPGTTPPRRAIRAAASIGNLRGLDVYKGHDCVIIAGREQTKAVVVEAQARALFSRDAEPLVLPGEYVKGRRRYETRDGHVRFGPVDIHPDPRVQTIVEQSRECETTQAVARLRLVYRDKPAEVYLLSSMPVPGLIVDRFVTWNGLLPSKADEAAEEAGGVRLLTPSEMARCFPDRWPTKAAAKQCARRYRLTLQKGTKALKNTIEKTYPSEIPLLYRVEGQRANQRKHLASVPATMGKAEAEKALAAIVGTLTEVQWDAEAHEISEEEATPEPKRRTVF